MTESTMSTMPPPPPPPQQPAPKIQPFASPSTKQCLATIVSYPQLLQHEESLATASSSGGSIGANAYDVMAWMSYLESVDDALDSLNDAASSMKSSSASDTAAADARTIRVDAAGRTLHVSRVMAPGITHTPRSLRREIGKVISVRIWVGERAVSLLPGSYKLWRCHLMFVGGLLERETKSGAAAESLGAAGKEFRKECHRLRISSYLLSAHVTANDVANGEDDILSFSSRPKSQSTRPSPTPTLENRAANRLYHNILQTYERSLVRLHKMPKLWLMYAAFVALHDPSRDPTAVRRIYDRALVALPASQHDRVWEEYLSWVTGILPGTSSDVIANAEENGNGDGKSSSLRVIVRKGVHKTKYGFEPPLVSEWRKRGWGYHQILAQQYDDDDGGGKRNGNNYSSEYEPTVPTETALRILRRHALCFDTTFREDLATLCITRYHRYGEAASLLLQLLNNEEAGISGSGNSFRAGKPSLSSGVFMSPNGTTRHELWLRFADVCTGHPREAKVAGVDFDGIVRAVLKGHDAVGAASGAVTSGGSRANGGIRVDGQGLGFQVFDRTSSAFGATDDDGDRAQQQQQQQQYTDTRVINHRLGEMEGTLWMRLAEYHVRAGEFELARSVYEEALDAITRVRDFSLVFDSYVKFEESVIEALMELMDDDEEDDDGDGAEGMDDDRGRNAKEKSGNNTDDDEDLDILLGDNAANEESAGASADVELAMARAEHLTARRPLLLNRVLLRQNPHNVGEWIKRSKLYMDLGEVDMATSALEESLKSVIARKAVNGSPSSLVLRLIDIHENERKDVNAARGVLERICSKNEYDFQETEDLAQCHAAWVELELRQENWDMALNLVRRSVSGKISGKRSSKAIKGLAKSLRLWNLLFDLEESLGTVQTTKDAYDRALEWKVATASHVLNYASFLKDHNYFEESFAAYERGLGLFPFPHPGAQMLWKNYLTMFLERYEGSKTPRVRELFDRCLADCPPEAASEFYIQYGEYEENHGLTKRALSVYERMCNAVPSAEKYTAYRLYIAKAIHYLGVTSARPIYESAIAALEDGPASRICLEYAKMETGLREIDRARTVLVYGAQLADPRRDPDYWKAWHEFEVSHGNEETFREMLRVKRSVQAAFSTVNYNAAEMGAGAPKVETLTDEGALEMIASREGVDLQEKPLIGGFVQGKRTAEMADLSEVERRAARLRQATGAVTNNTVATTIANDEIDIDDIEEEEEEAPAPAADKSGVKGVKEKAIPAAVFGGLAAGGNNQ
ncbi:hypothetical protein ACHAXS_014309 [Conticribra weissflogii]